jgi:hypothetical protein
MAWRSAGGFCLGAVWCAAALSGCAERQPADPALVQAGTITASGIRGRIAAVADDSTRGRATASPELDRVAAYAVQVFSDAGLRAGTATGFIQPWSSPAGPTPNTIAVLDGSDPALRDEYVLFLAHMDHIGTAAGSLGCVAALADSICNGADDNGSGVAAVMELGRAYGGLRDRPRRSMLFVLVSGEEEGLLGSRYFVAHPAVPLQEIVAAVNFDMIGRNARDSVLVIGMDRSSLGPLTREVGLAHAELGMRPVPAPWMGGSDHLPVDSSGVPTIWFFSGVHPDLHRPSDTVEKIDAEKAARIVRLAFYIGLEIANRTARPVRNVPAPPATR